MEEGDAAPRLLLVRRREVNARGAVAVQVDEPGEQQSAVRDGYGLPAEGRGVEVRGGPRVLDAIVLDGDEAVLLDAAVAHDPAAEGEPGLGGGIRGSGGGRHATTLGEPGRAQNRRDSTSSTPRIAS
jgi:hypothetical protein